MGQERRYQRTHPWLTFRADLGKASPPLWMLLGEVDTPGEGLVGAVLKAVVAHLYLGWIHPFGDGNGRTARMVEYYLLASGNIPSPAAHLLSNHYSLTKTEYLRQLHLASQSGGNILPFVEYAVRGLVDELTEQLTTIRSHQILIAWRDLVTERFSSASVVDGRRRDLLLDLSWKEFVPVKEVVDLSPRLARAYAGKSQKTISRDIRHLQDRGLVEVSSGGVRARTEILSAFVADIQTQFEEV